MKDVAIIGAGLSGLACARRLVTAGLDVTLFDKGRRVGGRLATRRRRTGFSYDHGAQYFTVTHPIFAGAVAGWTELDLVEEWAGQIVALDGGPPRPSSPRSRFVGVPGMQAIAEHLSDGLDVRSGCRIDAIEGVPGRFRLVPGMPGDGPFGIVVVAVPAAQAAPLLTAAPALSARAASVEMEPCWAVMLSFDARVPVGFDGAFVNRGPLSWIARDGSKPGRRDESWVLHAGPRWTADHWDEPGETVAGSLTEALADTLRQSLPPVVDRRAHRWRYAQPVEVLPERSLFDEAAGLAACGDWCGGPRVEGAFLSGADLAERILRARRPRGL